MFCYVILHYQNKEITMQSVEKIQKISSTGSIIIVDNCSPNGSGKELEKEYRLEARIHVILTQKNEGFAKGNNIGFCYAKETFSPQYIVVMNSDVFIEDKSFEALISGFMEENQVDVCGPDIITREGVHQNPFLDQTISDKGLRRNIIHGAIESIACKNDLIYRAYMYRYNKIYRPVKASEPVGDQFDCKLHGACIIYGENYIKREKIAFLPITYMYGEEAILYDYLQIKSYRTGVCSKSKVYHMQGKSTQYDDDKGRFLFRLKNSTYSFYKQLKLRHADYDYEKLSDIHCYK